MLSYSTVTTVGREKMVFNLKRLNKQTNKQVYIHSVVLVLLYFGIDFTIEYATDTYSAFNETGTWRHMLYENARPMEALIYYVIESLNIPPGIIYHISQTAAILLLSLSVAIFALILKNYFSDETLCLFVSFVTIVNPFFIEFMLFVEKGLFMFIILLNIMAVRQTERSWRTGESSLVRDIIIVQTSLWISVLIYQTIIQVYAILCLPFIAICSKSIKGFLQKNIFVMIMYGIPMGSAYMLAKYVFVVERIDNGLDMAGKLKNFVEIFRFVTVDKFYTLNKGLFMIWLLLLLMTAVSVIIGCRQHRLRTLFFTAYISVGCTVMSFLLYITGNSTTCWPRMVYTYGMLFGIVTLYLMYEWKKTRLMRRISVVSGILAVALLGSVALFNYLSFGKVFLERHRANQEDMYYAELIGQRISEYEDETGITIDTLCYYKDKNISVFGEGFDDSRLSERAQASGWSRHSSIEIYLDKDYIQGEPDPRLQELFQEKNWDMFSEEQLVFDGNVLHICVY